MIFTMMTLAGFTTIVFAITLIINDKVLSDNQWTERVFVEFVLFVTMLILGTACWATGLFYSAIAGTLLSAIIIHVIPVIVIVARPILKVTALKTSY